MIIPSQSGPLGSKDWRADVALIASIIASGIFTIFSAMMVYIVWRGGWSVSTEVIRINILGKALMLSLAGTLLVIITLGFAINRRIVRITKTGIEAEGGNDIDDAPTIPPAQLARTPTIIEEY